MKLPALFTAAFLVVGTLAAGLVVWVRAGDRTGTEGAGVEINYPDGTAPDAALEFDGPDLDGLTIAARRPGRQVELASLATLTGPTVRVEPQRPVIPTLPDIAATPFGLLMVDGPEAILYGAGGSTRVGSADALVWAGGAWVWLVRNVGGGYVEASLVDVRDGEARGSPLRLDVESLAPAAGLGLLDGHVLHGIERWSLPDVELLTGSAGGILVRDDGGFYTVDGPDAAPQPVPVPEGVADLTFAAPSPALDRVLALGRDRGFVVDFRTGESTEISPVVANPLRYAWTPDGRYLVWMQEGVVHLFDTTSRETTELGAATVAISYGALEIIRDDDLR